MTVVGIDASSNKTGMALFTDGTYVTHKLIDEHLTKDTQSRVNKMMVDIIAVLNEWKPDQIVLEETILKNNIATVKLLSYIAGAVMLWAAQNKVKVNMILPSSWRKLVGIKQDNKTKRNELKWQAVQMVFKKYQICVTDDEAESILLAESFFVY